MSIALMKCRRSVVVGENIKLWFGMEADLPGLGDGSPGRTSWRRRMGASRRTVTSDSCPALHDVRHSGRPDFPVIRPMGGRSRLISDSDVKMIGGVIDSQ